MGVTRLVAAASRPSVLLPRTLEVLAQHRVAEPLFPNGAVAEIFDAKYTRGPLRVYPRTDGRYVVIDRRRDPSDKRRIVALEGNVDDAADALNRAADAEGIPWDEEAGGPWTPPTAGGAP